MANTKSINKVKEYLAEREVAVSISDVSMNAHLRMKSVKECLDFLKQTNQIFLMSSSGTTLVQIKKGESKNATN